MAKPTAPKTIDEYIAGFPKDVQVTLRKIRATIRKAAPGAQETISYEIPTFKLNGTLISFAAFSQHIGLYPAPSGSESFNRRLAAYRSSKSTVKFPLDKPVPHSLVTQIVKLRVEANREKAAAKARR